MTQGDEAVKKDNKKADVFTMTMYQADKTQKHVPTLDLSQATKSPRLAATEVQNHAEILN